MEHVACEGRREEKYRVLWGKHEGKRPLLKSRRRWEDNIKIVLKEIGWETMDCSNLYQGRVAGCCGHCNRLLALVKCSEFVD